MREVVDPATERDHRCGWDNYRTRIGESGCLKWTIARADGVIRNVLPENMNHSRNILLALAIAALIGAARWILECQFVAPLVGPDPQIPIWIMVSTITTIIIAITIAPAAWLFLHGLTSNSIIRKFAASLPLLLLLAWYSTGFVNLFQIRSALLDSANPRTDGDRLRELANFKNGPGYEIDNRIAKHQNTPPDVLRSLHDRPDQVGTEMCLAANPNTPDDVLRSIAKLSEQNDTWSKYYVDALKRNPRYEEVFSTDVGSDTR